MIKRLFFCFFLATCMIGNLEAQDFPEDSWRDEADTSWFDEELDEFDIATAEELAGLSQLVEQGRTFQDTVFNIIADIDLDGKLWEPIGFDNDTPFSGIVQGNDHVISNLWITGLDRSFVGLFGQSVGGEYYDLIIDTANINNNEGDSGTLVANMFTDGLIQNCHVKNANLVALGANVGGLAGGALTDSYIKYSSFSGNVTGVWQVGGLVGQVWDKSGVSESWSKGTVTAEYIVGGLVGYATMAFLPDRENLIENSYSRSNVTATSSIGMAGGFYGTGEASLIIKNAYSTGTVTGNVDVGGFIGKSGFIEIENAYYDMESSGMETAIGTEMEDGPELDIEGKTTEEMTTPEFADTLNGEQEETPWSQEEGINEGYPFLGDGTMAVEKENMLNVNIYPTQVDQQFYIQSDNRLNAYEIYSLQGQKVAEGALGAGENEIRVGNLSAGIYIVKIAGEQTVTSKKIIKK